MKTDRRSLAIGGTAVGVLVLTGLFLRQSALQDELADLRAQLDARQTSPSPQPRAESEDAAPERTSSHIGQPRPFTTGTSGDARIAELERIAHEHADLLEKLFEERARIAEANRKASMRSWGPDQAEGPPDTPSAGDHRTAWAPAAADGGIEWLEADFEAPTELTRVVVRQTCNPGTITKVVAMTESGTEVPIWAGQDPSRGKSMDDTVFPAPGGLQAKRIRVYFDTSKLPGWEEVDAMQVVGRDGRMQWAKEVRASSTYAGGRMQLGRFEAVPGDALIISQ